MEETVQQQTVRVTDVDSRRLDILTQGSPGDPRDVGSVELLEDLDIHETIVFRVVFPKTADAASGGISVLAPLGMAVLGRRVGDHVSWQTPGGLRRLRVDRVLYQPEREGKDIN